MEGRLNPVMTRLSFALFHDRRAPEERLPEAAEHAGRMIGCLDMAAGYTPEVRADRMAHYHSLRPVLDPALEVHGRRALARQFHWPGAIFAPAASAARLDASMPSTNR